MTAPNNPTPEPKGEWTDGGKTWIGEPEANPTPEVELVEQLREILAPRHLQPKTSSLVDEVHALYADAISRLTAERDKWRDAWMTSAHEEAEAYRERDEAIERVAALETALEPFADIAHHVLAEAPAEATIFHVMTTCEGDIIQVSLEYLRRALAAREAK